MKGVAAAAEETATWADGNNDDGGLPEGGELPPQSFALPPLMGMGSIRSPPRYCAPSPQRRGLASSSAAAAQPQKPPAARQPSAKLVVTRDCIGEG